MDATLVLLEGSYLELFFVWCFDRGLIRWETTLILRLPVGARVGLKEGGKLGENVGENTARVLWILIKYFDQIFFPRNPPEM